MSKANELEIPVAVTRDDPELAARLRMAVTRLARRLRQEGQTGLTPSQTAALTTVERHGPLTPSEFAAVEGVRRPTATRALDSLEAAGLVVREADPTDGRAGSASASPTAAGCWPAAHPQDRLPGEAAAAARPRGAAQSWPGLPDPRAAERRALMTALIYLAAHPPSQSPTSAAGSPARSSPSAATGCRWWPRSGSSNLTGSALAVGLVPALQFTPSSSVAPFGGVLADRLPSAGSWLSPRPRCRSLRRSCSGRRARQPGVWMVYGLVLVRGTINADRQPGAPELPARAGRGRGGLPRAIALNSALISSARIFGPALAGVLDRHRRRRAVLPGRTRCRPGRSSSPSWRWRGRSTRAARGRAPRASCVPACATPGRRPSCAAAAPHGAW